MSGLSVGDLVILKSEDEIMEDDYSLLEWDHALLSDGSVEKTWLRDDEIRDYVEVVNEMW